MSKEPHEEALSKTSPRVSGEMNTGSRSIVRSLLRDIALDTTIPAVLYVVLKNGFSRSELSALLWATAFPCLKGAHDLVKRRDLDPVALVVLLGLGTGIVAVLFGGNPRLLLVRESFFTGAFGLTCLISLLLPRPIMFYFGRYFMAGADEVKREVFNSRWQNPAVRRAHRRITATWGLVLVGEFVVRLTMAYSLPSAAVLAAAPFLTGLATVAMVAWTFWYAHRVRDRLSGAA